MDVRNPRYDVSGDGSILLEILLDGEWSPFVARYDDEGATGRLLYAHALAGDFGTIANATPIDPVNPAPRRYINKMTMIGRLTEDEGDQVQAAINQAPGRLQLMYAAATVIDTQDANYVTLHDFVASILGVERADEILQPTE